MKKHIFILLLLLPAVCVAQEADPSELLINEVQVANIDQYLDKANCYGSWIELYNPSEADIPLSGLFLVDGDNRYRLPTALGKVPAGGFKVLAFDHYYSMGNYGSSARYQIPFKMDVEGSTISLQTSDSIVISSVSYPPSIPRCSWALTEDGGEQWAWTGNSTPGASNNGSNFAEFRLEPPTVDVDSKVFDEGFWVHVAIPNGYTLRYTLDGSAPTATNGETNTDGLFKITSTTILRLCFLCDDYLPSPVVTRSYIFRNHDYYLPILSVASKPDHFFDPQVGVFVKGTNGISGNGQSSACNWNMDWERPVNMEYLVPDGNDGYTMVLNQEVDLEICGGYSRAWGGGIVDDRNWETRTSFRLKTDKRYEGIHSIDYPVFPSKPHNKYRCWQVRNGGNDTYARIKDPAIQTMVIRSGFYVDCQDYQPAHVFLNGEYYGMLNIRESNNKHFAYSNYGIDFDDMDQFDLSNARYNQKIGDNKAWQQLQNLARKLAQTKSEETYREICTLLDIDEYVNYMALECYMGPSDWITNTNNIKGFRSRTDGKFHFVLFDTDSAFERTNMLTDVLNTDGGGNVDDLFRYLMKYDPFRRQFMDAFCIVNGSVFEPNRCAQIVWEIYENTSPALSFEGNSSSLSLLNTIRSAYNSSRINNMSNYFGNKYRLFANISANIPEARLAINGQEIPTGLFGGYLYSYKDLPIILSAKAPAGYTFRGWISESPTISISTLIPEGTNWMYYDQGSMDGFDWKMLSFDAPANGWQTGTAPFGFAKEGYFMQDNAATKLNPGSGNKRSTYYFRNTFFLNDLLSQDDVLTFNYQIDDGMMLYVNGHEVGGYYIDSGSTYSDYTINGHYEGQEPYAGSFNIPHEFLVVGENQIAVEVKNCHATSSDIWFEGSLTLTGNAKDIVADSADLDLHQSYEHNSQLTLKAVFLPITDERKRWEAGASPLRINEVNAVGETQINDYGKRVDWLELYNTTDQDISLEGLYLSDNPNNPQKYRMQEGIVPAHGTQIIWCDKQTGINQLHAPFKLANADGAKVSIQAADGSWADQLEYREHDKFQTFGRYPDGANMTTILNQPTIQKSNKLGFSDFNVMTEDDWLGPDRTITIDLAEGWNWTSHNMAESVDRSRFLNDALCLRGQDKSLLFSQEDGWQGTLQALEAGKGYKIKMQQPASVTLRGPVFDVNTPVSLQAGWNWIGCPLFSATTVEAALANYVPREGDKLVGLDAFVTYEDGQWHGSLKTLQPGQAYLFYTSQAQEFCFQSLSPVGARRSKRYAAAVIDEDEVVNGNLSDGNYLHAYPDVMTMVARVEADEQVQLGGTYCVGVFCGDECRGVGVMDGDLLYMNIHGDASAGSGDVEGGEFVFRLLDANGDVYDSSGCVAFHSGRQLGTVQKPFPLFFASQDILDEIKPAFAASDRIRSVQYFDLSGRLISSKSQPQGDSGTGLRLCIRKVIYEDGRVEVTKIFL